MGTERCTSAQAFCRCGRWAEHDGPHECDCGGSWDRDGSIVKMPGGITPAEAARAFTNAMMRGLS